MPETCRRVGGGGGGAGWREPGAAGGELGIRVRDVRRREAEWGLGNGVWERRSGAYIRPHQTTGL